MIEHVVSSRYVFDATTKSIGEVSTEPLAHDIAALCEGLEGSRHIQLQYHFDASKVDVRHRSLSLTRIDQQFLTVEFVESRWSEPKHPGIGKLATIPIEQPRLLKVWDGQTYYKLSEVCLIPQSLVTAIADWFVKTASTYPQVDWTSLNDIDLSPALEWDDAVTYSGDCVWI